MSERRPVGRRPINLTRESRDGWQLAVWASDLTASAKVVGGALAFHLNFDTGQLNPGIDRLSRVTNLPTRTVERCMSALLAAGFLIRRRHGHASNSYALTFSFDPPPVADKEPADPPPVADQEFHDPPLCAADPPTIAFRPATGGGQTPYEPKRTLPAKLSTAVDSFERARRPVVEIKP